ncbi:AbrB/MazE/SpoVT family DNA-binding domain-containing protein [Patescibacteria group bacterium]|nr:AbrB/MazE/SpoVT family DNA-binding domain-containing protein [Patescibacteria group bacterium]
MQTFTINIRPRRQTTIPKKLLEELNVGIGDDFNAYVEGNKLIFKPKKQIALEAFKELQKAIQESGISEKEMQENLRKIRQEEYESSQSIH